MARTSRRPKSVFLNKLLAAVSMLAFLVVIISGLRAESSVVSITFRAFIVILCISVIGRVAASVINSYEGMNSGKA